MLVSLKVEHGALFAGLRAVVVDEVHAFAGDDRGWHLLAVLERLTRRDRPADPADRAVGHRRQPGRAAGLAAGLGARAASRRRGRSGPGRRASASAPRRPPPGDVELDYVGSVSNAATVIASLHRGEKRLVFCDSRQLVEETRRRAAGARGHHVPVPRVAVRSTSGAGPSRRSPRRGTASSWPPPRWSSASTSATWTGSSRSTTRRPSPRSCSGIGRTGRRPGSRRNCLFLALDQGAAAVVRRAAAPVGPGIRRAGGGAAGAAAHRRPAAAGPVPAGTPDRQPPVGRGVERAGAVRPQRRAHPAVPGRAGVHRPGRRAAVHRPRRRAAVRAPALHGHDRRVHRPAAVHRAGRAAGDRPDRPDAAHREDRRARGCCCSAGAAGR